MDELEGEDPMQDAAPSHRVASWRVSADVANRYLERKFKEVVSQIRDSASVEGAVPTPVARSAFSPDALLLVDKVEAALNDMATRCDSDGDKFRGVVHKLRDAIAKFAHHIHLDLQNALGEMIEMSTSRDNGVPSWSYDIGLLATRGAIFVRLAAACVDRWLLNLQANHEYGFQAKGAAQSDSSKPKKKTGPVAARDVAADTTRLALLLVDEARRAPAENPGYISFAQIKSVRAKTQFPTAVWLETFDLMGNSGGLVAVQRCVAGSNSPAVGGPWGVASATSVLTGVVSQAPKRRRVAAGRGTGSFPSGVSMALAERVPLPPIESVVMTPWTANATPIATVKRSGNDSLPEVIVNTDLAAWTHGKFATSVRQWGEKRPELAKTWSGKRRDV